MKPSLLLVVMVTVASCLVGLVSARQVDWQSVILRRIEGKLDKVIQILEQKNLTERSKEDNQHATWHGAKLRCETVNRTLATKLSHFGPHSNETIWTGIRLDDHVLSGTSQGMSTLLTEVTKCDISVKRKGACIALFRKPGRRCWQALTCDRKLRYRCVNINIR